MTDTLDQLETALHLVDDAIQNLDPNSVLSAPLSDAAALLEAVIAELKPNPNDLLGPLIDSMKLRRVTVGNIDEVADDLELPSAALDQVVGHFVYDDRVDAPVEVVGSPPATRPSSEVCCDGESSRDEYCIGCPYDETRR